MLFQLAGHTTGMKTLMLGAQNIDKISGAFGTVASAFSGSSSGSDGQQPLAAAGKQGISPDLIKTCMEAAKLRGKVRQQRYVSLLDKVSAR